MAKKNGFQYNGRIVYKRGRAKTSPSSRSLKMRTKARPAGSKYNIEVRLCHVTDIEHAKKYGGVPLIQRETAEYEEHNACIQVLKTMGSGYKIIQSRSRGYLNTKVLLEREGDLVLMTMAYPQAIRSVYTLVD